MLRVYTCQTETVQVDGKPVTRKVLDEHGAEIVLWSVEVPSEIEAEGGDAIEAYVAAASAKQLAPKQPADAPAALEVSAPETSVPDSPLAHEE